MEKKEKRKRLKIKDAEKKVFFEGKEITVKYLFRIVIDRFKDWNYSIYEQLRQNKRVLYVRIPEIESEQQFKYVAKLTEKEYQQYLKVYGEKIIELSNLIPSEYKYAFYLENNIKYIPAEFFYVTVTDAYTKAFKDATKEEIKEKYETTIEEMEWYCLDSELNKIFKSASDEEFKKANEKHIEKMKNKVYEQLELLEDNKLYDIKYKTAHRFQFNYFDKIEEKSKYCSVGDIIFVPIDATKVEKRKRKIKKRTKEEITIINIPHILPTHIYESDSQPSETIVND